MKQAAIQPGMYVLSPSKPSSGMGLEWEYWKITKAELNEILETRPSARGHFFGFVAEYKLTKVSINDPCIRSLRRYDDHDRTRPRDFGFIYGGIPVHISVKSIQTASTKCANKSIYGPMSV